MNLACKSAILDCGVSHLIFPDEVQTSPATEHGEAGGPAGHITPRTIAPPEDSLQKTIELLKQSKHPAIIVGHGARFNMPAIIKLAESLNCPVMTTFKGKGLISDKHPLGCGVLGRSGTPIASWLMNESDCLLVLGASFSNHTGITDKKLAIQVDFDAMTLGKFHAVDVPVWGEIGITVGLLAEALVGKTATVDGRSETAERWKIWRASKQRQAVESRSKGINSASIFAAMNQLLPADAIIAVDVGNNTYSFGRYFECTRQSILMSGYLGSIGFAYPAAMGAWAATQEDHPQFTGRPVVAVSGDGGFGQYMAELTTAVKYDMNITHVLVNNNQLGKISKEQRSDNWDVWQTSLHNPNFAAYAQICGAFGLRVTKEEELDNALAEAWLKSLRMQNSSEIRTLHSGEQGGWTRMLINEHNEQGKFTRQEDQFRDWVTRDGSSGYPAEPGRYHLYVSLACPWAHRTIIIRKLKRLEGVIGMTVVDPIRDEHGWAFHNGPGHSEDEINGWQFLSEAYKATDPNYEARVTVPVLWDKKLSRIVSNTDDDIVRMLNSEFDAFTNSDLDYYPEELRSEIDTVNSLVYPNVNDGVYRAGFATTQPAYEQTVRSLFDTLDLLEERLKTRRYLVGNRLTEADWRLFPTLIRFDAVYHGHFKCNIRRIVDFPNLSEYLRDLYQYDGIAGTVNFDHIKQHYYVTHTDVNPTQIVPVGPKLDLDSPHGRNRL